MRIATEVLVEKYKDHLFAAAFNVCKNAADADDVVQDTFLQYHTTNRQFEMSSISEHGSFGWQSIKQRISIFLSGGRKVCR